MNSTNIVNSTSYENPLTSLHLTIDPSTLLQIDATVIAGILILLTLSVFTGRSVIPLRIPFDWNPRSVVAVTVIPFSVSALSLIWGSLAIVPLANPVSVVFGATLVLFVAPLSSTFGFVYLIWVILSIWMAKESARPNSLFEKSLKLIAKIIMPLVRYDRKRERRKRKERDMEKLKKLFDK